VALYSSVTERVYDVTEVRTGSHGEFVYAASVWFGGGTFQLVHLTALDEDVLAALRYAASVRLVYGSAAPISESGAYFSYGPQTIKVPPDCHPLAERTPVITLPHVDLTPLSTPSNARSKAGCLSPNSRPECSTTTSLPQ
jgi:hypothetical protein